MQKTMTDDLQRTLMIEEMIARGAIFQGYKDTQKVVYGKQNKKCSKCTKEIFMTVYSPELSWEVMAKRLQISKSGCIKLGKAYLGYAEGYKKPSLGQKVTDEQVIEAFKEYPIKKMPTIAKELKIHKTTLLYRARKLNLIPVKRK